MGLVLAVVVVMSAIGCALVARHVGLRWADAREAARLKQEGRFCSFAEAVEGVRSGIGVIHSSRSP
jgi:hypothetical protein